jgi:excisionase family DNA binding protein
LGVEDHAELIREENANGLLSDCPELDTTVSERVIALCKSTNLHFSGLPTSMIGLQFGIRENTGVLKTACLAPCSEYAFKYALPEEETQQIQGPGARAISSSTGFENASQAALRNAATGGKRTGESRLMTVHEVAELLQVPVSWVYGRMRKRCTEQLPGFRLGKYWRFSEREVLAWVASQRRGPHAA